MDIDDIRNAFYCASGQLYYDSGRVSHLSKEEFSRLVVCVIDNFNGKEINYEQALKDFQENE
jgi:hypothetical protein